ncbi:MAG: hypothetical protein IJ860_02905 [Eubacterium sp.]|nr:hypothetical protein [Eubacterium sp.]
MYTNYELEKVDPASPYIPHFHGTFEIPVQVGTRTRRMLAYAPQDVRESTAAVIVIGPDGVNADALFETTEWRRIADQEIHKEKLLVFFLEPENGVWNTDEKYGIAGGDVEYINAAALKACERFYYCVHESKVYVMGLKEGGVLANMAVAANPAFYAGIATVGGSAVSPAYLEAAAQDYCTMLDGYEDPDHRKNIRKGDIPVPAWIIDDPDCGLAGENTALAYWKKACGTDGQAYQIDPDCTEYRRTLATEYPLNQEKEAYRVCASCIPGAAGDLAARLSQRIWSDFLYRQRRWMSSPGGELRVTQDPVRDLHMEYHYETIDGWKREWYVYVPDSVRIAVSDNPAKKVPLVLAMHGYTCSGEIYIGNSGWTKVADQYGFIVVFPTALYAHVNMPEQGLMPEYALFPAWNIFQEDDRPDELSFFRQMLDRTIAEHPVDPDHVFATGHSWGSLMTQMLGLGMTDRLKAIAPCSGVFFGGSSKTMTELPDLNRFNDLQLPVWMHWGTEEAWLIPTSPDHDNETGFTVDMWMKRNGKADMIPENWNDFPIEQNGRFLDRKLEREGTAPVWFTQVDYMPHATMPEMSFRIWEQFFSRFL